MKKININEFVQTLQNTYPDATCSLDFETPFQLVVAVMLSAQCTDERVTKPHLYYLTNANYSRFCKH